MKADGQHCRGILHIIVVGFHHRKGSIVESIYPPLQDQDVRVPNTIGANSSSPSAGSPCELPEKWRFLPALAMPDGAHNYTKDIVYFALPSLVKENSTIYGVACYRQVDSSVFSNPNVEITRNTVQKSVVVLLRFPLFSYVAHHLSAVTHSLFESGVFTSETLEQAFTRLEEQIGTVLQDPASYQAALFYNLSVANFIRVYGRDALALFKLLLLERRILFDGDSAGHLSHWMLILVSLIPELLTSGLTQCAVIDPSWVSERACWPLANLVAALPQSSSSSSTKPEPISVVPVGVSSSVTEHVIHPTSSSTNHPISDEQFPKTEPDDTIDQECCAESSLEPRSAATDHPESWSNSLWSGITHAAKVASTRIGDLNLSDQSAIKQNTVASSAPPQTTASQEHTVTDLQTVNSDTVWDVLPPMRDLDSPFPTDSWGFPLALFSKSYILPLYVPLGYLDVLLESTDSTVSDQRVGATLLTDRRVRGFLAGATNPILRHHKKLADVIVTSLSPSSRLGEGPMTSSYQSGQRDAREDRGDSDATTDLSRASLHMEQFSGKQTGGRVLGLKRPVSSIRLCASSNDRSASNFRATPAPLARAVQLSRFDRCFIDELSRIVQQWHAAKSIQTMLVPPDPAPVVLTEQVSVKTPSVLAASGDQHLDSMDRSVAQLTPPLRAILQRFPDESSLDIWLRHQFSNYLRALLLTAEGYNETPADFNPVYIACLRVTHCFLLWRNQFMPSQLFFVSQPAQVATVEQLLISSEPTNEEAIKQPAASQDLAAAENAEMLPASDESLLYAEGTSTGPPHTAVVSSPPTGASIVTLLSRHPGRQYAEPDDWESLVDGFKRFGNMAADHGRRLVNQGMSSLMKFSTEKNAQLRASASSGVLSQISNVFKGLSIPTAPIRTSNAALSVNAPNSSAP